MKNRILQKLDEMNRYLDELDELLPSKEEYDNNLMVRRACEKTIESAIEAVISITSIIVSKGKLGLPQSEDDLIDILEKKRIVSPKLSALLKEMKGFRNILVHKYGEIDNAKVYHFLSTEAGDFTLFQKEVTQHLRKVEDKKKR